MSCRETIDGTDYEVTPLLRWNMKDNGTGTLQQMHVNTETRTVKWIDVPEYTAKEGGRGWDVRDATPKA